MEPINRSAEAFCQGERGDVGRSRMPIDRTRRSRSSHAEAAMFETIAGSILLAIAVLMFVLAGSGNKRLAVSATNDGAERDLFCQTCLRLPRKHCRRCQTGIWAREWQKNS